MVLVRLVLWLLQSQLVPLVLPHVDCLVVVAVVVVVVSPGVPRLVVSTDLVSVVGSHVGDLHFVVAVGGIHRGSRDDGDNLAFDPGTHRGTVVEGENRDGVDHRG